MDNTILTMAALGNSQEALRNCQQIANWGIVSSLNANVMNFDFVNRVITIPSNSYISIGNKIIKTISTPTNVSFPSPTYVLEKKYFVFDLSDNVLKVVMDTDVLARGILLATWGRDDINTSLRCPSPYKINALRVDNYNASRDTVNWTSGELYNFPYYPSKMFMAEEIELTLHLTSLFLSYSTRETLKELDTVISYANTSGGLTEQPLSVMASINPKEFNDTRIMVKYNSAKNNSYWYEKTITTEKVLKSTYNGKSYRVLMLGDSIMAQGIPTYTKTILQNCGTTPTFIGTQTDTGGTNNESYGGWSLQNFVGSSSLRTGDGARILPESNPFLRLATGTDTTNNPTWCFRNTGSAFELNYSTDANKTGDFYIFDFANYMTTLTGANPEVVMIALGTNKGPNNGGKTAYQYMSEALNIMCLQIQAVSASIKIGVIPIYVWMDELWSVEHQGYIWSNTAKALIDTLTGIDMVTVFAHMNRTYEAMSTKVALAGGIGINKCTNSDVIHPDTGNKRLAAAEIASYILNRV